MGINQKSQTMSYVVALISVATALFLGLFGEPRLGYDVHFLYFFSALAFASWYGGLLPGILATIMGGISVALLHLPPLNPSGVLNFAFMLHIFVFFVTGVFISVLMKERHDAVYRSTESERRLEVRVRERTAELDKMNRELHAEKNKLTKILDQMQEAVYIVNPQYEIEYANPAMEKTFGQVKKQKCYEYLNGGRGGVCFGCRRPEAADEKCFSEEWISPKNDRVYDRFEAPIVGRKGILCKLMILHDITNLKHTEAELSGRHREIQRLSSKLLTAQEAERMRISRELHDELGQALTLIKLKIGLVDMGLTGEQLQLKLHCDDASKQVDEAIENMRRLSRDLSPVTIDTLGITIALRRLVEDFSKASGIHITADIESIDQLLPLQSDVLLYRILQEGLNNIIKHSEATIAAVSVKRNGKTIQFELKDDGKGLKLTRAGLTKESQTRGLGLTTMSERVRTLGGSLEIQDPKDGGTRLSFTIPVVNEEIKNDRLSNISGG